MTPPETVRDNAAGDLSNALAELEKEKGDPFSTCHANFLERIGAAPVAHRLLPTWLAIAMAATAGQLTWPLIAPLRRRALGQANLLRQAGFLLGPESDGSDVRRLARRAHVERFIRAELLWPPRRPERVRVEGWEHLEAARGVGHGAIVLTAHMGLAWLTLHTLLAKGINLYPVRWTHERDPASVSGFTCLRTNYICCRVEEAGGRWIARQGAFPLLLALLERGEACWMTLDNPGRMQTSLGGADVKLSSGPAALGVETGAPIVPCFGVREGVSQVVRLFPLVRPTDFNGPEDLHAHLAGVLAEFIRTYPSQAVEQLARLCATTVAAA
jgi:KDO2-lipid IV(A) lauroyltransferase